MNKQLDLAALIRCLEVMENINSWDSNWTLLDAMEAKPWEVCKAALPIIRSILVHQNEHVPYGHDRISNQELKP